MGERSSWAKRKGRPLPCVFVDVNTQVDFLSEQGRCPVVDREQLVKTLRRGVAWAKRNQVPVVSSLDCHRREEVRTGRLPHHCLDGTPGQEKVEFTLHGSYVRVEGDNTLAVPIDLFRRYQQVIFRKRTIDFFLNPKADRFITNLPAADYVLVGVSIEGSIKSIALGLIARNRAVTVVTDACGYFDKSEADMAIRLLEAKGVRMITMDELYSRSLPRPIRYPRGSARHVEVALRNGLYASAGITENTRGNGQASGKGAGHRNGRTQQVGRGGGELQERAAKASRASKRVSGQH